MLGPPRPDARRKWPFVASLTFQGIPVDIEQKKGDTREGVDKDGTPWKVKMLAHYGEIRRTADTVGAKGMDGVRLDVYVGPDAASPLVVVVDQRIPETGEFDEQKVMLGFSTVADALACYRGQYTKPGFCGGHTTMTIDDLKARMADPSKAGVDITKALGLAEILASLAAGTSPEERVRARFERMLNRTDPVRAEAQRLLDATWSLAQRAQRYHWNVTGPTFSELHELFGEQYDEANAAVDEIAERMRAMGVRDVSPRPQGAVHPEPGEGATAAAEQVRLLLVAHQEAARIANDLARAAEDAGDAGTVDLAGRRALAHEKAAWMLSATMGPDAIAKAKRKPPSTPFVGPKGGKWANESHTRHWSKVDNHDPRAKADYYAKLRRTQAANAKGAIYTLTKWAGDHPERVEVAHHPDSGRVHLRFAGRAATHSSHDPADLLITPDAIIHRTAGVLAKRDNAPEPRLAPLTEPIAKAGPYIGPHGGKWADPKHTIPWHDPSASPKEAVAAHADRLAEMHGLSKLRVSHNEGTKTTTVHNIVVPADKRGTGTGGRVMRELTAHADAHGHRMALTPEVPPGEKGSKSRLKAWYKQHGFVENKGRSRDLAVSEEMIREPSAKPIAKGGLASFLSALIKAKFIRKVPTGKTSKTGKPVYRYIYHDAGATHAAASGEHVNLHKRGVHEVVDASEHGVTLRHAKTGAERVVSHEDFHKEVADAHKRQFDRAAESVVRKVLSVAGIKADPDDHEAVSAELRERFKAAGVDVEQAHRIIGALAHRDGWSTDAKKAMLALASDRLRGRDISANARQVMHGAENMSRADGSKSVEARHVHRSADIRTPSDTFDARLADARTKVAAELAQAKALMGAVEAASGNESARRAMVDYASTVMDHGATADLGQMAEAFPALRNLPEVAELHRVRAQWQGILAERAQRQAGPDGIPGAPTTVYIADANGSPTPQKARYRLVEADAAIASHDPARSFAQRKDYPEGVQERSYHRDKAEQEKVRVNAQKLAPAYVVNTNPDAVNGPPVMTKDGVVLGGNSRTMSIQLAYQDHPETAQAYREYLQAHAHEFGLSHGDVAQMKSPMLVREVDVGAPSKSELGTLVRRYNESFTQGMDPRVDQVARGRLVTQGMLDSIASGMDRTNDAGEPVHATLKDFLGSGDGQRFVSELSSAREGKSVIDRRNRSQFIGKDGKLNEDGKTFVERVLVGHAIPDPDLLSEMLPKHVSALATVVPHVVRAAAKGHDLHQPLKTALDAHAYMRRKGLKSVREYDNDSGGFGAMGIEGFEQKPKLDDTSRHLLETLSDKIEKPTQLASHFREFANLARQNPAGQADLTGQSRTTQDILNLASSRSKVGPRDLFAKAAALRTLLEAAALRKALHIR